MLTLFFCLVFGLVLSVSVIASESSDGISEPFLDVPASILAKKIENQADVRALVASDALHKEMLKLAQQVDQLGLHDMNFEYELGLRSLLQQNTKLNDLISRSRYPYNQYHYTLFAQATDTNQDNTLPSTVEDRVSHASDLELHKLSQPMGWSLELGQDYLLWLFQSAKKASTLSPDGALMLLSNYQLYKVYEQVLPIAVPLLETERLKRYHVQSDVLVNTPDGATISAIVVRKKGDTTKRPAAFRFSIYADEKWDTLEAMHAAAQGYVGVVAYTRGKAHSPDEIVPWEHDGKDAHAIVEWITKQPWSDQRVAMYGGSYLGFTQWAAAKYMHPALKTIVPYAAAHPFTGLPVENNIFITPNYQWSFHVTNNKSMDHSVYEDPQYWQNVYAKLFESGRAFRDIDKIEGTPNPWFQKLLQHPSYDEFYQQMLPYQEDFAYINIPVLSITGYFDGAAISAIDFLKRHYRYNKKAQHYLLTGPYTHGTAQGVPRSHYGEYKLDDVALAKDTKEITFQWFDHVLFGKPKPELIKDKVNYQLLGSNRWQHKPSYSAMNSEYKTFHVSSEKNREGQFRLTEDVKNKDDFITMTVDLADRQTPHHEHSWVFLHDKLDAPNGLVLATAPLTKDTELAGEVTGHFTIAINKKDVDIGFKLYEVMPDGKAFLLTRYISRASYAKDMGKRQLLTPGVRTDIPIVNSRMLGKLIKKDSRLVMVLNVNKNAGAQVNMGTGKDVSEETIADAKEPLEIQWFASSSVNLPFKP